MPDPQESHHKQVIGEYRLVRKLGRGGFGTVYLAEHIHEQTQAAVKVFNIALTKASDLKDFLNEASMMRLRHPHIMPLLNFGISRDDLPYLIMEYASGGTLRDRHPKGERVALPTVVSYVDQLASALQYAHDQHIIHRDVKPENILVRADGTLLVSDFGVSKLLEQSILLSVQTPVGTPAYMAPEQHLGYPCFASDQYALSVVIYEWLCGIWPFQGSELAVALQHINAPVPLLRDHLPTLAQSVEDVILKALAKDPQDRFASVQDFASALQQVGSTEDTSQPPLPMTDPQLPQASAESMSSPVTRPALPTPAPVPQALIAQSARLPPELKETQSKKWLSQQWRPGRLRNNPKKSLVLLLGTILLLLLVAGSSSTYLSTIWFRPATAIALTPSAATVIAARLAYHRAVAKNGVMFGFDAQHTHYNPYEVLLNTANVSQLHQKWFSATRGGVVSSPAVVGGLVYVGSDDHKLYAFDTATGVLKWSASTGDLVRSSPAIANGLVYISSWDGKLYAFDAVTGERKWASATSGPIQFCSPVVSHGLIYIGSYDNKLYAFDAATGAQKWISVTLGAIDSSRAVANGLVYVGSQDHKLYAFDATTGEQKWASATGDVLFSSPAVANGLVYIGSYDHKLYAFDAITGAQKWASPTRDGVESSPAVAYGLVYVGSRDNNLYAFDATTGKQKWVSVTLDLIDSPPAVANGVVYVGCRDRKLYAFDAATGERKWASAPTGAGISYSSPSIMDGVVYMGSEDGKLYAFSGPVSGS